jgi:hypothetical protein
LESMGAFLELNRRGAGRRGGEGISNLGHRAGFSTLI